MQGNREFNDLLFYDRIGSIKTKLITEFCKETIDKARELKCEVNPEKPECIELRERSYRCICKTACSEVYDLSTKCFRDNENKDSLFYDILFTRDKETEKMKDKNCTNVI
jgi:hypothetical protein